MAQNEAKIKFTADTSEFTAQIKTANQNLASLRAGMKLNDAEFKNSGNSATYLENKHKLLSTELQENANKQAALTAKIQAAESTYGANSNEVQSLNTQLTRAKTEEENLKSAIDGCESEMQAQAQATEQAQSPMGQLNSKINEQESELNSLKEEYKNVVLSEGENSTSAEELRGKIDTLSTELNENKSKMQEVEHAADSLGNEMADSGTQADSSANGGWTTAKAVIADLASNALQQAAQKLKEVAKEVVDLGIDFTSSMSNVQALSGATDDELAQLDSTAQELGKSTIFSASEVSDAFGYMALAGWDTEDMLNGIDGILNLAAAGSMDLANASDIVTDYLTAFGLSAQDSAQFVDQMTFAMANSNTDAEQLGEAYKNCAATSASMNYSVEDTTAVLMTMANAGVKGGEAGTALNTIMTRLATDTKGCATELEQYGVEVYDSQGNMNTLSSILNGVSDAWSGLTDEEQSSLAKTIAGTSQYSKLQTIMNGLSDDAAATGQSFNDYAEDLANCDGTAQEMADTMQDNLGGDLTAMSSALQGLGLQIFGGLEEPLRSVVQFITNTVAPAISNMLEVLGKLKPVFVVVAGAAAALGIALGIQAIINGFSTAMTAAKGAITATKTAMQALNTTMKANPIMVIVTLIGALVTAFIYAYNHSEKFREIVNKAFNGIKSVVETVVNAVVTAVEWCVNTATTVFNAMKAAVEAVFKVIKTVIINPIQAVATFISNAVSKIKNWLSFGGLGNKVKSVFNKVKSFMSNPISSARTAVSNACSKISSKLGFSGITSKVSSVFGKVKDNMVDKMSTAKDKMSDAVDKIKGFFDKVKLKIPTPSLPSLPHFSLRTKTVTVLKKSFTIPTGFDVAWYAKGAVFQRPTLLATGDETMAGVGEAGAEAVLPIETLRDFVEDAMTNIINRNQTNAEAFDYDKLAAAMARQNITMELNGREMGRLVRGLV